MRRNLFWLSDERARAIGGSFLPSFLTSRVELRFRLERDELRHRQGNCTAGRADVEARGSSITKRPGTLRRQVAHASQQ